MNKFQILHGHPLSEWGIRICETQKGTLLRSISGHKDVKIEIETIFGPKLAWHQS
jgi:hypothetical protein